LGAYTVHIQTDSEIPGKKEQTQFDFAVNGSNALFRMREPATSILDRSDRSILFQRDKLVAYDAVANESLKRSDRTGASYSARLVGVLGPIPDALTLALDPKVMNLFFDKFRGFNDWSVSRKGATVTLYRRAKGTETMFRFGGDRPLLREVMIKIPARRLHWIYSFKPGASISFSIPTDANPVYAFTVRAAPAKYASKQAKDVVQGMIKSYAAMKNGEIEVTTREGIEKLYLGGKRLREDRPGFQWSYDGSTLSVFNKRTHKFYRGKAIRVVLSEYLVAVGAEADPIIRRLVAHRTPYSDLFPTASTVAWKGTVVTDGVVNDIVQVSGVSPRSSIFIRHDNRLLQSIESETVDKSGRVLTRNTRSFQYKNLGDSPDSSVFRLNPGSAKVLPLPKLKL